jgi:mono/diheme cytochrome c family protein
MLNGYFDWLSKGGLCVAAGIALAAGPTTPASAADMPKGPMPEITDELVAQGQEIYIERCSFCHGLLGDGEGPAAPYMDPRPRDFTLGTFKFRTTQSGELPLPEDLFRTVSRGLPGTGMQAFDDDKIKNGLNEAERWAVISYVMTFAPEFEDPELDPRETGKVISLPTERAPYNEATIAEGRKIFEEAKCWECHGKTGRGNGQKAFDRKDDWGFPIRIRNVTLPWKIKGGIEVEDIYMRFSTGVSGTPMPSFVKALDGEKRWYLANFIKSLQHEPTTHQVLKVHQLEGGLPEGPGDAGWAQAEPMDVRLTGQVVAAPRWQNPSIELVTMRAVANGDEIAFLLEWDDPFADTTHDEDQELDMREIRQVGGYNSYVEANNMIPRALETFRDAVALQFPTKPPEGTKKPHFMRGSASSPVQLWTWKADLDAAEEGIARGWSRPPKAQAEEQQQVVSGAKWDDGRWHVVMKRPLLTEDKNDVQFVEGKFIPMALNAWDGSNGEHGIIMSVSTWHYVLLEAPTPIGVYLYTLLAVVLTGGMGMWMVRRAGRMEGQPAGGQGAAAE